MYHYRLLHRYRCCLMINHKSEILM
jgi:hypothetical protein